MTARDFLDAFQPDDRLVTGGYVPADPLPVRDRERVGVVLLNQGGPSQAGDVEAFLAERHADPVRYDVPVPRALRALAGRTAARWRTRSVAAAYRQIGEASPLARHTHEQAVALEHRLADRLAPLTGATFRTYVVMRYGQPSVADLAARLREDAIDRVVLLPLFPQYGAGTTGSALAWWDAHVAAGELDDLPATLVYEYAAHPRFIEALADRIDEALQRFPRATRDAVPLVFAAPAAVALTRATLHDPYCCLVHATVQQVMALRAARGDAGRPHAVALPPRSRWPWPAPWGGLERGTIEALDDLAEAGHTTALVVPLAFVSDRIESAYVLDICVREEALALGMEQVEVSSGLNCHPSFIEALAECVATQLEPADRRVRGDGAAALARAADLPTLPLPAAHRCAACPCPAVSARDWRPAEPAAVPGAAPAAPSALPALARAQAA